MTRAEHEPLVTRVDIKGELSIFTAAQLRQLLLDALDTDRDVEVDLSEVSEMDSAGMQIMVAAKREAVQRNKQLRFVSHSRAVFDVLELSDLSGHLGDPMLIQSGTRSERP